MKGRLFIPRKGDSVRGLGHSGLYEPVGFCLYLGHDRSAQMPFLSPRAGGECGTLPSSDPRNAWLAWRGSQVTELPPHNPRELQFTLSLWNRGLRPRKLQGEAGWQVGAPCEAQRPWPNMAPPWPWWPSAGSNLHTLPDYFPGVQMLG